MKLMKRDFPLSTLREKDDFEQIRLRAQDRKAWRKISELACSAAEAETIRNLLAVAANCNYIYIVNVQCFDQCSKFRPSMELWMLPGVRLQREGQRIVILKSYCSL